MSDSPPNSNFGRPDPIPKPVQPDAKPVAASASPFSPAEIGGYRIQRVLGSGGMAVVYAALQVQPKRTVALKVMRAGISADQSSLALRRFRREIEILGKLHHPNIAQVYDAGVHQDVDGDAVPFFVMEYISSAKNILEYAAAKNLSQAERLRLFVKVCAGVEHGHRHKVIHRDLKPGNILIDQYGEPKIIDFGVARAAELDLEAHHRQLERTEAGHLVGTLKYMAPEQVSKQPVDLDSRCDVYALGALLYKLLSGKLPHDFEGKTVYEAVRILREQPPTPPGKADSELRGDLDTIIMKAIDPDRSRRYRDAGALGRDILRFLNHRPIKARRAGPIYHARLLARRHRAVVIATAIFIIVLGIGVGVIALERIRTREFVRRMETQFAQQRPARPDQSNSHIETVAQTQADSLPAEFPPEPFTLREHTARIVDLRFLQTPEGTRLASASLDHSVRLWNLDQQQQDLAIADFRKPVTRLAASADGAMLAAATDAGPIRIINQLGRTVQTIAHQSGEIQALTLNHDGSLLAYAGEDFTLRVIEIRSAREMRVFRSSTGMFTCMAFSADGKVLAAGSQRDAVALWNLGDGKPLRTLNGLQGLIVNMAFMNRSGAASTQPTQPMRLIALSQEGQAIIWTLDADSSRDAATSSMNFLSGGRGSRRSNSNTGALVSSAFNGDGTLLAVALDEEVIIWSVLDSEPVSGAASAEDPFIICPPIPCDKTPCSLGIDPEGNWLAIGELDGDVRLVPISRSSSRSK